MAVADDAPQTDSGSFCVNCVTVGQLFQLTPSITCLSARAEPLDCTCYLWLWLAVLRSGRQCNTLCNVLTVLWTSLLQILDGIGQNQKRRMFGRACRVAVQGQSVQSPTNDCISFHSMDSLLIS